jgi:hypothetical protein
MSQNYNGPGSPGIDDLLSSFISDVLGLMEETRNKIALAKKMGQAGSKKRKNLG